MIDLFLLRYVTRLYVENKARNNNKKNNTFLRYKEGIIFRTGEYATL